MSRPFVPATFTAPTTLQGPGFRLEPLGPHHNERDHEAWMSSIDHIRSTPGFDPDGDWPVEMRIEANLADLDRHARHFVEQKGFTYSVLDGDDVIGRLYIYPTDDPTHDASVGSWVRASRVEMDTIVWEAISVWLDEGWPFEHPRYVPRPRASQ